ncbi:unnamed protein product [Caenorhabditis auriculariae]|uniref:Abnormal cell migration protein 18-like fibronectin type I domain-containing protein n=1 Tax=Caenorhabditis auriculariae TaxID=2777116 RepID=A0A8S1HY86_9PELO|nr:unnamed protein product [Caenorhabditis auriculariae]
MELILESSADICRCWTSGNGKPAQWWQEGSIITRGKFFYECSRGQLAPRGCFSADEKKVQIGQTFQQDGYEFLCSLGADGYLEFKYSGCISQEGKTYGVGQTWADPKNTYYFKCKEDGQVVKKVAEGCIAHDKQRRVPLGETDDFQGYTYKCQEKSNGVIQMCSVGCIHEGVRYAVGQQWQDGDYLYYCKTQGGKCTKQCIGCYANGDKLFDGQRYKKDGTTFQCEIRRGIRRHRAVGCVISENGKEVNKVIGCRWYLHSQDSKIEQTCETNGQATKVVTVGCIFRQDGFDRIFLEPGRYTIWNLPKQQKAIGIACRETSTGADLETFNVEQLESRTVGLKYDTPRGK